MLIAAWLYTVSAPAIVQASGTTLLDASQRWCRLVLILTACIAAQILIVNTTAWGARQHLPIWIFIGAAPAYPVGLLILSAIAAFARRMARARRFYLCAGLAVVRCFGWVCMWPPANSRCTAFRARHWSIRRCH